MNSPSAAGCLAPYQYLSGGKSVWLLATLVVVLTGCGQNTVAPPADALVAAAADPAESKPEVSPSEPVPDESLPDGPARESEFPAASNAANPATVTDEKPVGGAAKANVSEQSPQTPPAAETANDPAPPNPDAKPADAKPAADDPSSKPQSAVEGDSSGNEQPQPVDDALTNPFPRQIAIPDFPKDMQWLNTAGPLRKRDLQGKFVILDFWTYCCINCIHILPELKKLEKAYPNQLVVIGVHSAKFEAEKGTKNIEEAILRYEIEHPVVNDHEHLIWNMFGVRSWPTVMLIDPAGNAVWYTGGEIQFEDVDALLKSALPYYRQQGLLDETPLRFELLAHRQKPTPLRFPGKVLTDVPGNRLFITDSNHNRIVVTTLEGKLLTTIGSGAIGRDDGDFSTASFDHPQGLALHEETLYVADTENHMLRKIDLKTKQVTTIAGLGIQGRNPWLGLDRNATLASLPERYVAKPSEAALNSPWALWVHGEDLYIAMAGPHQIWKMPLDESEIGPYAGNGREDIVDGPLLPRQPYQEGYSSFAQPSGLTSDGKHLFVADSEGSSIRAVPFSPDESVTTLVGTADLPHSRLFTFGDQDGKREDVLLQHALGVEYVDGRIFVADTYNNKIKVVDAKTGETTSVAGSGEPGASDSPAQFDEPAGIAHANGVLFVADTNNHVIRTVEVETGKVATLSIAGLDPPQLAKSELLPDFSKAPRKDLESASVKATNGSVTLEVALAFPTGWKLNKLAPLNYWIKDVKAGGPVAADLEARGKLDAEGANLSFSVPVSGKGQDAVEVSLIYYYCQEGGEGVCKMGSVVWQVPLDVDGGSPQDKVVLPFEIQLGLP